MVNIRDEDTTPDRNAFHGAEHLPQSVTENARLEKDRRAHDRMVADRRQSDRAVVDARAALGSGQEGQLYSLSANGCSLRISPHSFKSGDAVQVSIEALKPLAGIVRWVDGDKVGIEFDQPFYPAVFELLVHANKPVTVSRAA